MKQLVQGIELLAFNKEADKLATEYVKRGVIRTPVSPFLPKALPCSTVV